jgi:shikimate kinase
MGSKNRNIFLVGLMAVGKTTVGRLLADELAMPFFDTDRVVEEKAGAEIAWIFDVEGEAGFREREVQVVDELTARHGVVLATGGGVVLREENRRNLAARGTVIYLDSPIDRLVERTRRDKRRPLLQNGDARATLRRLAEVRGPLYASIADYRFCADRHSAKSLASEIANRLRLDGCVP